MNHSNDASSNSSGAGQLYMPNLPHAASISLTSQTQVNCDGIVMTLY